MPERYFTDGLKPRRGHCFRIEKLDATNPKEFAKFWNCYAMTIDHDLRPAYGDAVTDKYLSDIKAESYRGKERKEGIERQRQRTLNGDVTFFACYEDELVVGISSVTDWSKYGDEYKNLGTQVSRLFVLPGYKKFGVGKALLQAAEQNAYQERGVRRLYLEATIPSESFYTQSGYVDAPADDSHIDTSGSTIVGRLMYKDLDPEKLQTPPATFLKEPAAHKYPSKAGTASRAI